MLDGLVKIGALEENSSHNTQPYLTRIAIWIFELVLNCSKVAFTGLYIFYKQEVVGVPNSILSLGGVQRQARQGGLRQPQRLHRRAPAKR